MGAWAGAQGKLDSTLSAVEATEGLNQQSDLNWSVLEGSLCPPCRMDWKRAKVEAERLPRRLLEELGMACWWLGLGQQRRLW